MNRECQEWAEEGSTCSVSLFPVPWRSNCSILPTLHLASFRIFYIPCSLLEFLFLYTSKNFHTLLFLMLESHKQNPALYITWWNLFSSLQSVEMHHLNVCLYHIGVHDLFNMVYLIFLVLMIFWTVSSLQHSQQWLFSIMSPDVNIYTFLKKKKTLSIEKA